MTKYTKSEAAVARNLLRVFAKCGWTQEKGYSMKDGSIRYLSDGYNGRVNPTDVSACCLAGACYLTPERHRHRAKLDSILDKYLGKAAGVVEWNDSKNRTWADIERMLRTVGGVK